MFLTSSRIMMVYRSPALPPLQVTWGLSSIWPVSMVSPTPDNRHIMGLVTSDTDLGRTGATAASPAGRGARPAWRAPPASTGPGPLARGSLWRSRGRGPHRAWCHPGHWRWSPRGPRAGRGRTWRGNASSCDNCSGSFSGSGHQHFCKRTRTERSLGEMRGLGAGTGGGPGEWQ